MLAILLLHAVSAAPAPFLSRSVSSVSSPAVPPLLPTRPRLFALKSDAVPDPFVDPTTGEYKYLNVPHPDSPDALPAALSTQNLGSLLPAPQTAEAVLPTQNLGSLFAAPDYIQKQKPVDPKAAEAERRKALVAQVMADPDIKTLVLEFKTRMAEITVARDTLSSGEDMEHMVELAQSLESEFEGMMFSALQDPDIPEAFEPVLSRLMSLVLNESQLCLQKILALLQGSRDGLHGADLAELEDEMAKTDVAITAIEQRKKYYSAIYKAYTAN